MQLKLIESDIRDREEALKRCRSNLYYLHTSYVAPELAVKHREAINFMEQEVFFLRDQLEKFYILANILKEEQGSYDEMLPKV